jgi:hypothetical protein
MDKEYVLKLSWRELLFIFEQVSLAMELDYRQHILLTEEMQMQDAESFCKRQQFRFSLLLTVRNAFKEGFPEDLLLYCEEAEGIMLYVRGLENDGLGRAKEETP